MKRLLVIVLLPAAIVAGCALLGPPHSDLKAPGTAVVAPFEMGTPDAVLVVTGGTHGRMEICFCSGTAPGGLSRRASLIRSYRAAYSGTVAVDLGDAFFIDPHSVRNDFVLLGYRQVPYDILVMGDQELAVGGPKLQKLLAGGPVAFLSSTVAAAATQPALALQDSVERDCGALKLAFLSYIPPQLMSIWPQRAAELSFTSLRELAQRASAFKAKGCTVVLIVHGDNDAAAEAAAACTADLILQGHALKSQPSLRTVGGRPVARIGSADVVGVVAIKKNGPRLAFEYRQENVDDRWPIDSRLLLTYEAYAHAALSGDGNRAQPLDLVPSAQCGQCHAKQYEAWQKGPHAKAYATLAKTGKADDAACIICHSTSAGTAGGFVSIETTPGLANVNCQDCHHVDASDHQKEGFKAPPVAAQTCEACHTPMTSPGFNTEMKKIWVRCPH